MDPECPSMGRTPTSAFSAPITRCREGLQSCTLGLLTMNFTQIWFQELHCICHISPIHKPFFRVFMSDLLSTPFRLLSGTHQVCPLSSLIFALVMELLVEAVRAHTQLSRISITDTEHKICLYADDIILTISHPLTSLLAITS